MIPLKERWSERAQTDYLQIIGYLLENWSKKEVTAFIERVEKRIALIKQQPYLYRESKRKKGVRKSVITKHISLYYRVSKDEVQIITLRNNRQDPTRFRL